MTADEELKEISNLSR